MRKYLFTVSNRLPQMAMSAGILLTLAACASAPPPSVDMTWNAPSVTPKGYAEYCAHYKGECLASPAGEYADASADLPAQTDNIWNAAFAMEPASMSIPAEAERARAVNSWNVAFAMQPASLEEPTPATKGTVNWAASFSTLEVESDDAAVAAAPVIDQRPAQRVALTDRTWALLSKTNVSINNAIIRADDLDNDGVPDRWNLPLLDGTKKGDCEDYALEKRRQLIKQGLPAEALSLAIVRTSWGETHAVLVVDTDRGAYVLDSLNPWVTPWTQARFQWITRQAAGGGLWVRPGAASFQTASLSH